MIKFENLQVLGFDPAVRGMRNPLNSWNKSDSMQLYSFEHDDGEQTSYLGKFRMGEKDHMLANVLSSGGDDHAKYLRYIWVYVDITAPLYWWKEFDTYKVGTDVEPYFDMRDPDTVTNSCSTMHKLHSGPITMSDFSCEDLFDAMDMDKHLAKFERVPKFAFSMQVQTCEYLRQKFVDTGDPCWWRQLIQMLPSSYNQKRTVQINYMTLKHMMNARKNHKLKEWRDFVDYFAVEIPYSELIYAQALQEPQRGAV